jgi:GAF domain-containing protein
MKASPRRAATTGRTANVTALRRERDDALEQQAATAEVMRLISRSGADLQPVFDKLTETAARLCKADMASIARQQGDRFFHSTNNHGFPPDWVEFAKAWEMKPGRGSINGRALASGRIEHVRDVLADPEYTFHEPQKKAGYRTFLAVPLLRDGHAIGVISLCRKTVKPFSKRQIELVSAFADQAAIAIENARLFHELHQRTDDLSEALRQQTATGEILASISSSLTDAKPVFEAIVRNLHRLLGTRFAVIQLLKDGLVHMPAADGEPGFERLTERYPRPMDYSTAGGVAMLTKKVVRVAPILDNPDAPAGTRDFARDFGFNSVLFAPMLRGDTVIGVIGVARREPELFDDKQAALIQAFADQAVIAIENVRLFDEVQARTEELNEALHQQTATADVLKVISRSAFDLPKVLQTLLESAVKLAEADNGTIARRQDGVFYRAEAYGFSEQFLDAAKQLPITPGRDSAASRALLEGRVVQIPDILADPDYTFSQTVGLASFRTALGVPMLRDGNPIGILALTRSEMRPFTDKQIELVSTFADQAAIAIENSRLFEEVQSRTRELTRSLEELRLAQDRLVQTEKLASLGQLTAGIAHEIKNPLNFVNNFSAVSTELIDELNGVLKSASLDARTREEINELTHMLQGNLEKVVQHGKRADSIVKNMLLHSRQGSGEQQAAEINTIVEESLNLAYHGARAERSGFNITLRRDLDPQAGSIDVYPQEITRVLLNLISNGFYAATKRKELNGGQFEPVLSASTRSRGDSVEIRIRDNGTGIPEELREKVFNPFFTTKPAGEGTGLGLSMSHDIIVKQHGGRIDVDSVPGEFTEFVITLPRKAAQPQTGGTR